MLNELQPSARQVAVRGLSKCFRFPSRSHGTWDRQYWKHVHSRIYQPNTFRRGAKTRTTLKAADLPQGTLPPLPQHEDDKGPPERSYPPVLQQHLNNVHKFKDCVILTRVGDFYEMYFDQVEQYAPLVNLKKAKRATALGDVPMAGFQYTQLERYLKMFVQDLGKQVAISEQVRIPDEERANRSGTQQYDRKVTRVVTPGTLIDEAFLDPYENNFLLSIHVDNVDDFLEPITRGASFTESRKRATSVGLAWVDLSSGDFYTQAADLSSLPSTVARIGPREVLMDSAWSQCDQSTLAKLLGDGFYSLNFQSSSSIDPQISDWTPYLESAIPPKVASTFTEFEISAASLILDYAQKQLLDMKIQLRMPIRKSSGEYMSIDKQSLRGLEVRTTLRDGVFQGSLLHAVRRTVTRSGARLLSQRLVSPSMSLSTIDNRLDLVEECLMHENLREDIIALLRCSFDTLRLLQKFALGRGDADDLLSLARTVLIMQCVRQLLHSHVTTNESPVTPSQSDGRPRPTLDFLQKVMHQLDLERPLKVAERIQAAIDEEGLDRKHQAEDQAELEAAEMAEEVTSAEAAGKESPKLSRRASKSAKAAALDRLGEVWVMRKTASPTLERAHSDLQQLIEDKAGLAARLRVELKADSLTLKWSPQLGHFCHVKGKDAKSTLVSLGAVRSVGSTKSTRSFYLSDWSHLGVRIDDAKRRIRSEEERVFEMLRNLVIENLVKLRRNAAVLDELDVACSFATLAKERDFVRPTVHDGATHTIIGGRHPMVDMGIKEQGRRFTSNDCSVGVKDNIYLITGPNMGGKSTYLRQNALITILAQTGSFVPADYASIGLVDKLFSRVGSADNLFQDQSTFMVEMLETAEILKQATSRSFVIMDEVGRGTTPEDGVAIGYACLHHLHNVNKSRTLFATHFHALTDMTRNFDRLGCYCTHVEENTDGSWSFVHKLHQGVNTVSHALKVARLAGLPEEAIRTASDVLDKLSPPEKRAQGASVEGETRISINQLAAAAS